MNKKFKALAALAVSGAMALTGCHFVGKVNDDGVISDAESNKYDETIVAEINGQDMTLADFNFMYYNNATQIQQSFMMMGIIDWENQPYDGGVEDYQGKTYGEIVREVTLDQMTSLIVGMQRAKEYGILVDDDVVYEADKNKKQIIDQEFGGSEEEYENYLDYCFISDYTVEKYLQRSQVITDLIDQLSQDGEVCAVTDKEVEDSFVKASHVLISVDDDTTDEQALATANEVIAKLDGGADMKSLIAEYGEDPGMENQDYYVFTEGEMVDEFYEAAKALGDNEYTKTPVRSSYGYHVIYRYPLASGEEGYEDVTSRRDEVRNTLINNKFSEHMQQWIDTASRKVYDDVLDEALAAQQEELAAQQQAMLDSMSQQQASGTGSGDAASDAADASNSEATEDSVPEMEVDPETEPAE